MPGNPAAEARLAVLASDASLQEKAQACHELAVVGGPESVPALALRWKNKPVDLPYKRDFLAKWYAGEKQALEIPDHEHDLYDRLVDNIRKSPIEDVDADHPTEKGRQVK